MYFNQTYHSHNNTSMYARLVLVDQANEIVSYNRQKLTLSGEKLMTTGLALDFPAPNLSLIIYINKI